MGSHYTYLTESSPKTVKGEALDYLTAILYLSPEKSAGFGNVCPYATLCVGPCLNTSGRAGIMRAGESTNAILEARKRRTRDFFADRNAFITALHRDIGKLVRRAERLGMKPAVRLNGTSDLRFDKFATSLFTSFPEVRLYDYTKDPTKLRDFYNGLTPSNYHVTFSWSGTNRREVYEALRHGVSVAVPYRGDATRLPYILDAETSGVVDGDAHDLRFLDPAYSIVALKAKGRARKDRSGFVVDCT